MTETAFPRKPFLDRVIVRELPLEEIYQQSEIAIPLDDARVKDQSDRGIVVAVGDCVPVGGAVLDMPVRVGDLVFFEDTTLYDPIYLNPADKRRSDLPKYWQIRVGDLKGYDVARRAVLDQGVDMTKIDDEVSGFGATFEGAAVKMDADRALECAKCGLTVPRGELELLGHKCERPEAPVVITTADQLKQERRRHLA